MRETNPIMNIQFAVGNLVGNEVMQEGTECQSVRKTLTKVINADILSKQIKAKQSMFFTLNFSYSNQQIIITIICLRHNDQLLSGTISVAWLSWIDDLCHRVRQFVSDELSLVSDQRTCWMGLELQLGY